MLLLPIPLLVNLLIGLLSLALLAGGAALVYRAYRRYRVIRDHVRPPRAQGLPREGVADRSALFPLLAGLVLLLFPFAGRRMIQFAG